MELNYTGGLTNIGYGLSNKISRTKALQQAFILLGKRVGLNSAIASPSIIRADFKGREKALSESIEFIAGLKDNIEYARGLEDPAYDIK
ncbi:MAG: hypothetical protein ABIB71_00630 [Candidatus Woesearchaeota archaeon]